METCVFCKIANGLSEASKIYEDEKVIAIMDIKPVNQGHILVIPKQHFKLVTELDDIMTARIFMVAKRLNQALKKSGIKCEAVTYLLADGESAKQEIPHVHLHIIPRFENDGFGLKYSKNRPKKPSRKELDESARDIKSSLI